MDRVIETTTYPLVKQKDEAHSKRRMGLGVTGLANTLEAMGLEYGSSKFIQEMEYILSVLKIDAYTASVEIAQREGAFPLFHSDYLKGKFFSALPSQLKTHITKYGIRNSHLTSIAPTGTISMCADNISSGIEPTYASVVERVIQTFVGPVKETITDYGVENFGNTPKTAEEVKDQIHVSVLCSAQKYVDSAVSKTINVSPETPWTSFKSLYYQAWSGGAKGCTTFNPKGKRTGIITKVEEDGPACKIDAETGARSCDE